MRDDHQPRLDDETTTRTEDAGSARAHVPVVRLLANPRRVRRV